MKDVTSNFDPQDIEKNKVVAGLSYLGILFFLPLVACPDSKFGRFHANQSLILLLLSVAGGILFAILNAIAAATWSIGLVTVVSILSSIFYLVVGVGYLLGLILGCLGQAKELPLIGKISIIKY